MHKLVLFDEAAILETEGWRLRPSEVADFAAAEDLLARCLGRLGEIDALCERRREQARAEGFAAGFADGEAAARRKAAAQLRGFLEALASEQASQRAAVGRLALEVARKIVGDLSLEQVVEQFVLRRLEDLKDEHPLEVRVPSGRADDVSLRLSERGCVLRVVEDPNLGADECAFQFASGQAHAGVGLQFEALASMVRELEARAFEGSGHVV